MSLNSFLQRLIWLSVLPLILLAAFLAFDHVESLEAQRHREAVALVKNFALSLDQMLRARSRALELLAASPHPQQPEHWEELYHEAVAFRDAFGAHVILADPGLHMLFNTRAPLGSSLPMLPRSERGTASTAALESGRPQVGDIVAGPVAGEPLIAIVVPGVRDGKVAFLLLATIETRLLRDRLDDTVVPDGWSLTLLDGNGNTIARRAPPGFDPATDVDAEDRFIARSTV